VDLLDFQHQGLIKGQATGGKATTTEAAFRKMSKEDIEDAKNAYEDAREAMEALDPLPDNAAKRALGMFADHVVSRTG
jgi:hypothetical protein